MRRMVMHFHRRAIEMCGSGVDRWLSYIRVVGFLSLYLKLSAFGPKYSICERFVNQICLLGALNDLQTYADYGHS